MNMYEAMTSLQIMISTHQWSPHERHCVYIVSSSEGHPIIIFVKHKKETENKPYVYDDYRKLYN